MDQMLRFQLPQLLGEHLGSGGGDAVAKLGEAEGGIG